jgi:hypothetical protein
MLVTVPVVVLQATLLIKHPDATLMVPAPLSPPVGDPTVMPPSALMVAANVSVPEFDVRSLIAAFPPVLLEAIVISPEVVSKLKTPRVTDGAE